MDRDLPGRLLFHFHHRPKILADICLSHIRGFPAFTGSCIVFGKEIKGATSWFVFGGFSFQPSELAKFATNIAMAAYLSSYSTNLKQFRHQLVSVGLLAAPLMLILLQPDAGSALVFLSFFIVLFREGFPLNYFIFGLSGVTLLLLGFLFEVPILVAWLIALGMLPFLLNKEKKQYWLLGWAVLISGSWYFFQENTSWPSWDCWQLHGSPSRLCTCSRKMPGWSS
ncbi:MAG: FtsW/RodA/SpoVE family cell cycle protein [Saprospirales bacterium]|nr:FtsW/RodA/SpoVE family cell cycle protein [Saprospirales bacterium]